MKWIKKDFLPGISNQDPTQVSRTAGSFVHICIYTYTYMYIYIYTYMYLLLFNCLVMSYSFAIPGTVTYQVPLSNEILQDIGVGWPFLQDLPTQGLYSHLL